MLRADPRVLLVEPSGELVTRDEVRLLLRGALPVSPEADAAAEADLVGPAFAPARARARPLVVHADEVTRLCAARDRVRSALS